MKRRIVLLLAISLLIVVPLLANSPPSYAHWEKYAFTPLVLTVEDKKQIDTTVNKYAKIFNPFIHQPLALPFDRIEYHPGHSGVGVTAYGKEQADGAEHKVTLGTRLEQDKIHVFTFSKQEDRSILNADMISREKAISIGIQIQKAVAGGFPEGMILDEFWTRQYVNSWMLKWKRVNRNGVPYVTSEITIFLSMDGFLVSYSESLAPECNDKPVLTEKQALEAAEKARRFRKVSAEDPAGPYYPAAVCYQPFPGSVLEINDPLTYKYKDLYSHKKKFGKEYFKREPQSRLLYIFTYNTCIDNGRTCGIGGEDAHEYLAIPVDAVTGEVYPFPERLHAVCPEGMKAVE